MEMEETVPSDLDELFVAVLDHLLVPEAQKQHLIASQSREKKIQMIKLNKNLIEKHSVNWGERENSLLLSIAKAKMPDLNALISLKAILGTANKEILSNFLGSSGISVLVNCISERLKKQPITEFDSVILHELLLCFKAILNNSTGMDSFLAYPEGIDCITKCLNFDYRILSLQVLEILSVCCYYSEQAARDVWRGVHQASLSWSEAPFSRLTLALIQQDAEIRVAIMLFVNNLLMGLPEAQDRVSLRGELRAQWLPSRLDLALSSLSADLQTLEQLHESVDMTSEQKKQASVSLSSVSGPRALEAKLSSLPVEPDSSPTKEDRRFSVVSPQGLVSGQVNPLKGLMSGALVAAKNATKGMAVGDLLGIKKTKQRTYTLTPSELQWTFMDGKEAGSLPLSSLVEVRSSSSDPNLNREAKFSFEIVFADRILALGCETVLEKENWITALSVSKERQSQKSDPSQSRGASLPVKILTIEDLRLAQATLTKARIVFDSIAFEDRKASLTTEGLDIEDLGSLCRFLQLEGLAAGTQTHLSLLLREVLLLPPGMPSLWEKICADMRETRKRGNIYSASPPHSSPDWTLDLEEKAQCLGSPYPQMGRLALAVLKAECEAERLKKGVSLEVLHSGSANSRLSVEASPSQPTVQPPPEPPTDSLPLSSSPLPSLPPEIPPPITTVIPEPAALPLSSPPIVSSPATELTPEPSVPLPLLPTPANEKFAKFEKMKKMLPEGAVRQKMSLEGITDAEIDAFFRGEIPVSSASPTAASSAQTPPPTNEKFAKFEKMKKMLPEGAVRQKMSLEGITDAEIDAFFRGEIPVSSASPTAASSAQTPPPANEKFAKFEKMKKMLPEGAVRQKMKSEGLTDEEIHSFFEESSSPSISNPSSVPSPFPSPSTSSLKSPPPDPFLCPPGMTPKPTLSPPLKMRALYWQKLPSSSLQHTLWYGREELSLNPEEIETLHSLFSTSEPAKKTLSPSPPLPTTTNSNVPSSSASSSSPSKPSQAVSLLDGKRTQNLLITLGKIKMSPLDIASLIIELDPSRLTLSLSELLSDRLPSTEECSLARSHPTPQDLDKASQLVLALAPIPRLEPRVRSHITAFRWFDDLDSVFAQCQGLDRSVREVEDAQESLSHILSCVLSVGNYLNGGTSRGQAYGVKLDVLQKVCNVKANDAKQGSLLHFVVRLLESRAPQALRFSDGWTATWAAAEVVPKQLDSDIKALGQQVDQMRAELKTGVPRVMEEAGPRLADPLKERIEGFLAKAEPSLSELSQMRNSIQTRCRGLLTRFGEKADDPEAEFSVLKAMKDLSQALSEAQKSNQKSEPKPPTSPSPSPSSNSPSLSSPYPPAAPPTDNLFSHFQSAQQQSSEDMLMRFKNKRVGPGPLGGMGGVSLSTILQQKEGLKSSRK